MLRNLLFVTFTSIILTAQPPTIGSCSIFPADNIWNTPVNQLPVSPSSSTYINTIGATTGAHADFGAGTYNGGPIGIPFISVPGAQVKYPASFLYAGQSDPGPYAIPLTAPIEGGSQSTGDRHAIAIDTDNCFLYEIYDAFPQTSSWQAGSGAIFNTLSNGLRPATWTSADAAGLPILPGLVRYDEVLAGEIRHAVRFTVPDTLKGYVWPARHYASTLRNPKYPPMGARFRLRASFNISSFSPVNQVILKALQTYGMMIADNGSAWYISGAPDSRWDNDDLHKLGAVTGSDFELVDVSPLMIDPNSGQAIQTAVSVSINPPSTSVPVDATNQFTANVLNSSDPTVSWSVNGIPGGNAETGWINSAGSFTAPSNVPSPPTITVQATSNAQPSAVGTSLVTITAPPPALTQTVNPPSGAPGSVSFQTGAAGYAGAQDGTINNLYLQYAWNNGLGTGTFDTASLDIRNTTSSANGIDSRALIKFTGISIPTGKTLTSASLTLTFANWIGSGTLNGYYLNTPWVPGSLKTFNWADRGSGLQWAVPGASGNGTDRVSGKSLVVSGFKISGSDHITIPLDLTVVQSWLNNPAVNQGILLVNPTVGWVVSAISSEGSPVSFRPILTLNYQ